jgi:hypothetical protein
MRWRSGLALIAGLMLMTAPTGVTDRAALPGYLGSFVWTEPIRSFGGFSAIELNEDGTQLLALSDRGSVASGRVMRDAGGRITRIEGTQVSGLRWPTPRPAEFKFDAEGLALDGRGGFYVSTEFISQVLHYAQPSGRPSIIRSPPDFTGWEANGGPEALAIGADGTLYVMPEVTPRTDGSIPVYRYRNGTWDQPMLIAGDRGFLPAGADIGPDGKLYLLERKFYGLGGFASKVRRVTLVDGGTAPDETLLETRPGTFGNLEGIAVSRDQSGGLRMTMISDDNFLSVLGTELVEFRVAD